MNTLSYATTNREVLNYRRRLRRQQIIRRRVVFMILTVFLIMLFSICFSNIITRANDDMSDITYKYFTKHEVVKGDTLWNLAKDNIDYQYYDNLQDYVDEVIEINHLKNDNIFVGQNLIIPYFSNSYY